MAKTPDAVAREWFEEVWNKLDEKAIDRLMHPNAVAHGLGPQPIHGPAAFKPFFHSFKNALAGIKIDVVRTIVEGDMCAIQCRVAAKHAGPGLGGPATNKPVAFWGVSIVRVKDGQIVEGWNSFDFLTMYQQMGWIGNPVLPV
jgi:predicted SnoaL-like aldol condensation-catalyzing enzyme